MITLQAFYLVPAEVAGAPAAAEEGGAGLALVELAARARGGQARRGDQIGRGGALEKGNDKFQSLKLVIKLKFIVKYVENCSKKFSTVSISL